jgi:hypothetical protein
VFFWYNIKHFKKGDLMYIEVSKIRDTKLAEKFEVTVQTLQNWKKLNNNVILPTGKIHCYRAFKLYFYLTEYKDIDEYESEHFSNFEFLESKIERLSDFSDLIGNSTVNQKDLKEDIKEVLKDIDNIIKEVNKIV